jgi:NAD(P)-dependent dehydrogenase (short-subunit alcohol dehydrogenase family)
VAVPRAGDRPLRWSVDGVVLITDDGRGVAPLVAAALRARGARPVLARLGKAGGVGELEDGGYRAALTSPAGAAELVAAVVRRWGPVSGILHLLPLSDGSDASAADLADWRRRVYRDVKSLFYLAKASAAGLKRGGDGGSGWLVAAAAMGGTWAAAEEGAGGAARRSCSRFAGHGAIAGLVKALAAEWPAVRCKAVDLDPRDPPAMLADALVEEIGAGDGHVQVGYRGGRRFAMRVRAATFRPASAPPAASAGGAPEIGADCVLLVTGGARGITGQVATHLAERYRPTLVLAGRSAPPRDEESPETAGLTTARELKAALVERARRAGGPVTPALIEEGYRRLVREREMRGTLARIRATGARVRYEQADVRSEEALARLVRRIEHDFGRLDGVIHGAGVIEDKLVEDKTAESFDRVFDTKVDSAFILSRVLRPETLRWFVLFSSAAGVFGNRGQCDYAAANEALNALAVDLDARWPGRVVAIAWGPWAAAGMVSPALERHFAERGVPLIPVAAGCRAFDREMRLGRKGEAAVIAAGGVWSIDGERLLGTAGDAGQIADTAGAAAPLAAAGVLPAGGSGDIVGAVT